MINNKFDYENFESELNNFEKKIFNLDKDYRDKENIVLFLNFDNSKLTKFLFYFCAHSYIYRFYKNLKPVFENKEIVELDYPHLFFKLCDIYSKDLKKQFVVFPTDKRNENIRKINQLQEKELLSIVGKTKVDNIINLIRENKFKISGRSLVLYFRQRAHGSRQVDYLEFSIMYYILDWYINSGYSRCFDSLNVVARFESDYPQYLKVLFKDFNFLDLKNFKSDWSNFVIGCGIGSNIVHLADGDFEEIYTQTKSIPIISEAISHMDRKQFKKCVKLKGVYYDRENDMAKKDINEFDEEQMNFIYRYFILKKSSNNGDFNKLMKTILESVIELENKLIRESENEILGK